MSQQLDVLRDVTSRLDRAGVPYMVTGSIAMSYYAEPRMTRDIDIVVELSLSDVDVIGRAFSEDYYLDLDAARTAVASHGMFNIIHLAMVDKVDFIVRKDEAYRLEEFGRRRCVELADASVWIVAPEDLVLSKLGWARQSRSEVQMADVRNLLGAVADMDLDYLEGWAARLGLEDLLREARS